MLVHAQEMLVFQGALIPLKYENCYLARQVRVSIEDRYLGRYFFMQRK